MCPESLSDLSVAHLQQAAGGGADVRHGLVLYDGDQQGREKDICHLPVEEVHSVIGLRHHGGLVPAGGIVLHALWRGGRREQVTFSQQVGRKERGCCCADQASRHP